MAYSEKFRRSGNHGDHTRKLQRLPRRDGPSRTEDGSAGLTGTALADIVRVIERKLAWYGFTSVKIGPFIRIAGGKVFIDLLDRGEVMCRLELDRTAEIDLHTRPSDPNRPLKTRPHRS
jgi:hypothetical protein